MKLDRRKFIGSAAAGLSLARTLAVASNETDPLGVRGDFRATVRGAYFNTPYIGPIPNSVERAGMEFTRAKAERPISLPDMLEKTNVVRRKFATLFGADPREIGFLFATSEGENLITSSIDWKPGDNVVVDDLHYTTTYVLYKTLEETKGVELRIVRSVDGRAGRAEFEPQVDSKTRLVSVSWVSHQNGYRHPLKELAELAHSKGAYLYTDGIQALGMFRTNLREEGVDFVTSGTYKWLFGSYGIAPFFLREEHLDRIQPDRLGSLSVQEESANYQFRLFSDARKYEYATLAFGPLYQLDAAIDYLEKVGLGRIEDHTVALAHAMHRGLVDLGFRVRTPEDNGSSIVAFFHGQNSEAAQRVFQRHGVQVSFREGGTQIRAGAALFNNREDVDRLLVAAEELRSLG